MLPDIISGIVTELAEIRIPLTAPSINVTFLNTALLYAKKTAKIEKDKNQNLNISYFVLYS